MIDAEAPRGPGAMPLGLASNEGLGLAVRPDARELGGLALWHADELRGTATCGWQLPRFRRRWWMTPPSWPPHGHANLTDWRPSARREAPTTN